MNTIKKLFLAGCWVACLFAPVQAQVTGAPVGPSGPVVAPASAGVGSALGGVDLASLSKIIRADFIQDQHGVKYGGLHVPALDYHDAAGDEVVNFNAGLAWAGSAPSASSLSGGSPMGLYGSASVRIDYVFKKWNGGHVTLPVLPKLEVGPFGCYGTAEKKWLYGLFVATTFGQ